MSINEELKAKISALESAIGEIKGLVEGSGGEETEEMESEPNSNEVVEGEESSEEAPVETPKSAGTKVVIGIGKKKMPDMLSKLYK